MEWTTDYGETEITYGIKVIVTGQRNAYDEALDIVWNHSPDALSVSFTCTETLPGAEYAGACYIFDVELPGGIERAAVSRAQGIFFTYSNNTWFAFTGAAWRDDTKRNITLGDIRAISEKIGEELAMSDLHGFIGEDIGSGFYILRYPVEDVPYVLSVTSGGSSMPM